MPRRVGTGGKVGGGVISGVIQWGVRAPGFAGDSFVFRQPAARSARSISSSRKGQDVRASRRMAGDYRIPSRARSPAATTASSSGAIDLKSSRTRSASTRGTIGGDPERSLAASESAEHSA